MQNKEASGPTRVQRLPKVQRVLGMFFDGQELVRLQYQSEQGICELQLSLDEALKSEDWFIQLRRSLAPLIAARRDGPSTEPVP